MPLMSMPRICAGDGARPPRPMPASFTPPALPRPPTSTWALMTTLPAPAVEEPLRGRARLGRRVGDLLGGDGQALGDEERLGVASWIFTRGGRLRCGGQRLDGRASATGRRGAASTARHVDRACGARPAACELQSGHGPPRHPDPRRRHRAGAGGGDPTRPRGDRASTSNGSVVDAGEARHRRVRHAAAGARPRVDPAQTGSRSRARSRRRSARASGASTSTLRQALGLYANLRPARSMKGLETRYEDVDLVIVRENTEDLYAGIEHMVGPRRRGEHQDHHPRGLGADRPLRLRLRRRQRPAQGHGRPQGQHHEALRRPVPRELPDGRRGVRGPRSSSRTASSTTCACSSSRSPSCTTCSCCRTSTATSSATSRRASSAGWASRPGANIGTEAAVFEPVHGSAPKYAGQDKANPTALILSGALMLRHLGEPAAAERVETAVRDVIAEGRTDDVRPRRRRPGRAAVRRRPSSVAGCAGLTRRASMTTALDPARRRPRPPLKPPGTAAPGSARRTGATAGGWRPGVQAIVFTVCATYLFVSGILLTPLFGTPYEVDGYLSPLFSPLIAPGLAADAGSAPASSSCGSRSASGRPATTTARPTTGSTSPTRPAARSASRRSTGATGWRRPSRSSSRTSTATSCISRSSRCSSCGSTRSGRSFPPSGGIADRAGRSSCSS